MAIIVHSDVKRIVVVSRTGGRVKREEFIPAGTGEGGRAVRDRVAAAAVEPATGRRTEFVVVEPGRRRKQSRGLRPLEKMARRLAERESRAAIIYLTLHERSNRRKSNGWIKDLGSNLLKAVRRSRR